MQKYLYIKIISLSSSFVQVFKDKYPNEFFKLIINQF